jgi:hypothetical protein
MHHPQHARQRWLGLDSDDPSIQPPQARDTIANMCADVEDQIAGLDELTQQPIAPVTITVAIALDQ